MGWLPPYLGALERSKLGGQSLKAGLALGLHVGRRAVDSVELLLGVLVRGNDWRQQPCHNRGGRRGAKGEPVSAETLKHAVQDERSRRQQQHVEHEVVAQHSALLGAIAGAENASKVQLIATTPRSKAGASFQD
jgi:hypothetical protein